MRLIDVINSLDIFEEDKTIYAVEPWNTDSKAIVAIEQDDGSLPGEVRSMGMSYFLEVFLAKEFLEGWIASQAHQVTIEEKCARLISYAINDA